MLEVRSDKLKGFQDAVNMCDYPAVLLAYHDSGGERFTFASIAFWNDSKREYPNYRVVAVIRPEIE